MLSSFSWGSGQDWRWSPAGLVCETRPSGPQHADWTNGTGCGRQRAEAQRRKGGHIGGRNGLCGKGEDKDESNGHEVSALLSSGPCALPFSPISFVQSSDCRMYSAM